MTKKNYNVYLFLSIVFFSCLIWVLTIPFNNAPDEYMRMDLVDFMFKNNSLPKGYDQEIMNPLWGFSYAYLPYFPQIIATGFVKIAAFLGLPKELFYLFARFPNVIYATATAWFGLKIGDIIFKTNFKWLFVALISFLPQVIFLNSYLNNESLAILGVMCSIYCWLYGSEHKWNLKSCIGLAVSLSVCILTYYNCYGFVLMSIPFFIITQWKQGKQNNLQTKENLIETLKKVATVSCVCFVLAGWWFIRQYVLYHDFLGMTALKESCELYAIEELKPSQRIHPSSLRYMLFDMRWIEYSIKSFIGVFGYMSVYISEKLYHFYYAFFGFGIFSNVFSFLIKIKKYIEDSSLCQF